MAAVLLLAGAAGAVPPPDDTGAALAVHLERRPEAEAVDIYKFLHQGVFGPGHMVQDRSAAERYLEHETKTLELVDSNDPLCEALGGSPAMVRIHLRPYLEAGFDDATLIDLFVESANQIKGDVGIMNQALRDAVGWLKSVGRIEQAGDLEQLRIEHHADGFPALHHSEGFRAAYHPAYRVILRELATESSWCPR
jgi:hypothetical protein